MSDPIIVPLKTAGDSLTMAVTHCAPSTVGNYPEIEFVGTDGPREVMVRMPKTSAERQFTRLSLTQQSVVGKIITISRDPNKMDASKPFWGISLNGDAPKSNGTPAPVAQQEAPADDRTAKLKAVFALQEVCFTHALKLAKAAEKEEIVPTFEGVSALTAQAMIEACRRGIV
jgi:hypothetical protein